VPFCRIERAISSKRVVFWTDEVIVLEDPGQPVGNIGNQRTTRTDLRPRPVRRGLQAGHRINAEATRGSAGAGEGTGHSRARVPTAEARVGAKRTGRT